MCSQSIDGLFIELYQNTDFKEAKCSETVLNRPTMGSTLKLNGRLRELEYCYNGIAWAIIWDPNKTINIEEWWICGGGWLKRFYCSYNVCRVVR